MNVETRKYWYIHMCKIQFYEYLKSSYLGKFKQDRNSVDCGVFSYFEVNNKGYFALLPLKGEKELDFSQKFMLYEVEEDEENNPIVMYIENDYEYAVAAQHFSNLLSKN